MSLNTPSRIDRIPSAESLKGWAPVEMEFGESLPIVKWQDLKKIDFSEPLFFQTLQKLRESDSSSEICTGIDELLKIQSNLDSIEPTGFIFHVSRCGSTLVSNALRALEDTIVISEAQPVAAATWLFFDQVGKDQGHNLFRSVILRAVVRALGQRKLGTERRYFIKFSSLEVLFIEHIKRLWPAVPWLFVIRNPIEVIVSNLRKGATWTRFQSEPDVATSALDCSVGEAVDLTREEYCARMIGRTCRSALEHAGDNSLFVDYNQLTPETLLRIARFFGVEPSIDELLGMEKAATRYSKDPSKGGFIPDAKAKQDEASELVRRSVEQWALEDYLKAWTIADLDAARYLQPLTV
jgi:hypothetical protein